jgi:hypothetical protein
LGVERGADDPPPGKKITVTKLTETKAVTGFNANEEFNF